MPNMSNYIDNIMVIKQSKYGSEMRRAIYENFEVLASREAVSKELTWYQYQQLSSAEKMNGVMYFITDTGEIYKNNKPYGGRGGSTFSGGNFQAVILPNPVALGIAANAVIDD